MIKDVAAAFARQDYPEVKRLLKLLPADDPWALLYQARLDEATDNPAAADAIYRQLLRGEHQLVKIMTEARQGLERLNQRQQQQRQQAIQQAIATVDTQDTGLLILEPVPAEHKAEIARAFADVMQIDPYAARMLLPSRSWRLYRTGAAGEIQYWQQQLQAQDVPACWLSLLTVQQVRVWEVVYCEAVTSQTLKLVVKPGGEPTTTTEVFTCPTPAVQAWVAGALPLFEDVVDRNAQGKLQRKTQTQDYVQCCDLHIAVDNNRTYEIFRLNERTYRFNQGLSLIPQMESAERPGHETAWANWKSLIRLLDQSLPKVNRWSSFQTFGETAIEFKDLLEKIPPGIDLFRQSPSPWDAAFHLYSCLILLQHQRSSSPPR